MGCVIYAESVRSKAGAYGLKTDHLAHLINIVMAVPISGGACLQVVNGYVYGN